MERRSGWAVLLCVAAAVVVAPVVEEFLFRLLLQGWLEALERRLAEADADAAAAPAAGFGPVLLSSLLFAAMHFRVGGALG